MSAILGVLPLWDVRVTGAPPKDREIERAKAKALAMKRFGPR